MPESLAPVVVTRRADVSLARGRVDALDLSDASSVLAETCSALALSLREGDLDAAERLFAFIVDQMADRRSAVTGVLAGMLLGTDGCTLLTRSEVSTTGCKGVLLHCAGDGAAAVMLELTALLLDDAHVPLHLRRGFDDATVARAVASASVAVVAYDATSRAEVERAEATIRQLRRAGVAVVMAADPETVAPDLARAVGASAAAWQPGEITDVVLRLRGPLSRGEAEVLRLASDGYTNVRIAHELDISLSAVKARLEGSYAKLRAADRTHAVAIALRQRWIQ